MSNPDWPGPYWQQQDDAGAGRRGRHDGPPQDQSPWEDAGFWRADDRPAARADDWQAARSGSRGDDREPRRAGRRAAPVPAREDRWDGRRGADDRRNGDLPGGQDRPRRGARGYDGAEQGAARGNGRFSQTTDDLKNRLGMRGSVVSRDRSRTPEEAVDADFWGDADGRRPSKGADREGGRRGRDATANGSSQTNGASRANGSGRVNGAGRASGAGRAAGAALDGGETQAWQENGAGAGEYRGSRRAGANGAGSANGTGQADGARYDNGAGHANEAGRASGRSNVNGYANGAGYARDPGDDEGGSGQWAGRTAVRDRAARISEGVRSRAQRPGGSGGRGGGSGFDGGDSLGDGPLNRRQRFKRYLRSGDWWRHWTWKKVVGLIGAGIAACFLLGALGLFIIYEQTPIPTESDQTANWQSSTVTFSNGKPLGTFDNNDGVSIDRQLLTDQQIPRLMTEAMTAAEDRDFYSEGGISITGLVRSAYEDVLGSGNLQGGSTITMQYAKNHYSGVDAGQNASTKLKEIFIAMKLAHEKSKQWIMTQYLNTVPFGTTIDGVGAAAQSYFSVNLATDPQKLTYEEAAELAALPNNPSVFSPDPADAVGYKLLQARWHYVLTNMVRDGNITQQEASQAVFPKYNPPKNGDGWSGDTGYLMQMVSQEIEAPKKFGGLGITAEQLATGGYRITTTFSQAKIHALYRAVNQEKAVMRADGTSLPYYDHIGAVLEDPSNGAITAVYGGPGYYSKHCTQTDCFLNTAEVPEPVGSSFKPLVLSTAVSEGMNVLTSKLNGYNPIWIPLGSSPAVRNMLSLTSNPTNATTAPGPDGSQVSLYELNNGDTSDGPISVADAAATSSDPGFTDLAHKDGIQNVINMAGAFGVGGTAFEQPCFEYGGSTSNIGAMLSTCNDLTGAFSLNSQFSPTMAHTWDCKQLKVSCIPGTEGSPAIALGEGQLTPVEQASIFATLANDGTYNTPHVIAALSKEGTPVHLNLTEKNVLSAGQAADVDYALSFDNVYGTAANSVPFRNQGGVIAKTGTLGVGFNTSQAWFVGATPRQEAMSVALYTDKPGKQILTLPYVNGVKGTNGGAWPASIWNNYFTAEWGSQQTYPTVQGSFPLNTIQFQTWIQAKPKKSKLQACKPGQTKNCKPVTCKPGRFMQPCTGGGNPSPNPSSNPTPTPTCSFPGQQNCTNPTPTASPSPSVNPTCTPVFPGGPCSSPTPGVAAHEDAAMSVLSAAAVLSPVIVGEDRSAVLAASLSLLVT